MAQRIGVVEARHAQIREDGWFPILVDTRKEGVLSQLDEYGSAADLEEYRVRSFVPEQPKAKGKRKISTGEFLDRLAALGGDGKAKRKAGR